MTTSNFTFEAFYRWTEKHSSGTHYVFGEHGQKGQAIIGQMNTSGSISVNVQVWAESNIVDAATGEVLGTDPYAVTKTLAKNYAGMADGKWHHIAATFQNEGATSVRTTLYCDYEMASTATTRGQIRTNLVHSLLYVGGAIEGHIDEIRISKGVLPADAFLRRQTQGLVLILK